MVNAANLLESQKQSLGPTGGLQQGFKKIKNC